ncbi:hypothetical protein TRVL_06875 [Trypanosoma vivax]|nr:hypothetical protein TRVL_06875 [Trypanosoma vivax]
MPLIDEFGDSPFTAHWLNLLCKLAVLWLPDEVVYCDWWPRVFILLVMLLWCIGCVACAMMHSGRSWQLHEIRTSALLSFGGPNTSLRSCCVLLSIAAIGTSL